MKTSATRFPLKLVLPILLVVLGCTQVFIPRGRDFEDYSREIFILNSLAETITVIDADTLTVHHDVQFTGSAPNHLLHQKGKLYLTNSLSNTITVLSEDTLAVVDEIYLGKGHNPWMVIPVPDTDTDTDTAYVPNFAKGTVSLVNLETGTLLKEINVGAGPAGGSVLGERLFICNTGYDSRTHSFGEGTITVINTDARSFVKTIPLGKGSNPQAIIPIPSDEGAAELHVVLTGTNGGPNSNDGKIRIYSADTSSDTYTLEKELDIGGSPSWNAGGLDETNKIVYLTGVGGVMAYNYAGRTVLHPPSSDSNYILQGADSERDLYGGVVFDSKKNRLIVSDFTHDKILLVDVDQSTEAYTYTPITGISPIPGSDGPGTLLLVSE